MANPYARSNPIETGIRSAAGVIGIQDAVQARDERAVDRGIAAQDREDTRKIRGLQVEQAELGIAGMKRQAKNESDRADLIRGYAGIGPLDQQTPAAPAPAATPDSEKRRSELMRSYPRAVQRVEALQDPEVVDSLADFATGMQEGNPEALQAAWPKVLNAFNRLNVGDVDDGIGETVPGTKDVIVGKELSDLRYTKAGTLVPVLTVTAKAPDGTLRTYEAPATVGRNTDPNAPLMELQEGQAMDFFTGALETGIDVQEGKVTREQLDREFRIEAMALGMKPDEIDAIIGGKKPQGDWETRTINGKPVTIQRFTDNSWEVVEGVGPYEKPSSAPDSYQFLPTDQGYMVGNRRTAEITPPAIGLIRPAQYDPETQRTIAAAKSEGKAEGTYAGSRPKVLATLKATEVKTDQVVNEIDDAISMVSGMTAGAATPLSRLPMTPARNLRAKLDTIRANVGFSELNEMRANSPTGGALGQVTERELAFLQAVIANLDQDQSPDQLRENLQKVKSALNGSRSRIREAYAADFGEDDRTDPTVPALEAGGGESPQRGGSAPAGSSDYSTLWGG